MKRFIFLTFGFMGWAFYEMSGGASFDPEAQRMARLNGIEDRGASEATDTSNLVTAALANAARQFDQPPVFPKRETPVQRSMPANDGAEVTRVALNLTTLSDLPRPGDMAMVEKATAPTPTVTKAAAPASNETGAKVIKAVATSAAVPHTAGYRVSSADTPAIIPSLIDPEDSGVNTTTITQISTSQNDLRTVSGNRVNVRGGPGTNFGVVGKLGAGETVEVIEDNGAGWVRFRTVGGEESGWMADFLLSNG